MATTRPRRAGTRTDAAQQQAIQAMTSWATFTWGTDTGRAFGRVPHVLLNWVATILITGVAATRGSDLWRPTVAAAVIGMGYTIGRAARHLPARQDTLNALYADTAKPCGHPTITRTNGVTPKDRISVTRWRGPGKIGEAAVMVSSGSAAADPSLRWQAERPVETLATDATHEPVFDWTSKPGVMLVQVVPSDSPQVRQKGTTRWIGQVIGQLFPARRGSATGGVSSAITWAAPDTGADPDQPEQIVVSYGAYDVSERAFRDGVEAGFDRQVARGVVWVYDWAPGVLTIRAAAPGSGDATRKLFSRKVSDVVVATVGRVSGRGAAGQATCTVTRWVPEGKPAENTPTMIEVTLGTADFSSLSAQRAVEAALDQALENEWRDRVWLADWTFGHTTTLRLVAVPRGHQQALRKAEEIRLREVVAQKFPAKAGKAPTDVDVREWLSATNEQGQPVERPVRVEVTFGTYDVNNPVTRQDFEGHLDSLTADNDWRYEWDAPRGRVVVTAVPTLPSYVAFPEVGTPEHERWQQAFRAGKIILGPAKGGYEAVIDLNKLPHTLVGGSTGAGKSVLLMLILYGALSNPDVCELVVIDPKVTDFTWTPGYPNVRAYAVTDAKESAQQINFVVRLAFDDMVRRQNLLNGYQRKNLGDLRRAVLTGEITNLPYEDIPKRLIVFFDEGGSAFTPSKNVDIKGLQDQARTMMEQIGMLGRAMECNIVMAAQKPSAENIGTAVRAQLNNKIAVGPLLTNESIQVLGNNYAATMIDAASKGRGIYVSDTGDIRIFQTYYLPERSSPDPLDPTVTVTGTQDRVADVLDALGWVGVRVPTTFTREDPTTKEMVEVQTETTQWVRADRIDR